MSEIIRLRERVARLETALHDAGKCPNCVLTQMECADVIARFELERTQEKALNPKTEGP